MNIMWSLICIKFLNTHCNDQKNYQQKKYVNEKSTHTDDTKSLPNYKKIKLAIFSVYS